MLAVDRSTLLSAWIKPSSDDEKTQQDRAERMVREAVDAHPAFKGVSIRVYTKGSYPNNTNVRRDSDVDVVVELQECIYYEHAWGISDDPSYSSPYQGNWTRESWRAEVETAMSNYFGSQGIDTSGNIAIQIHAVPGSRPSADVVPSFQFRRYTTSDRTQYHQGSCVWDSKLNKIVNWPAQQLENGKAKNTATGGRYKNFVRALKNAENVLSEAGTIDDLPSYFMECLVYNVANATLKSGNLDAGFKSTLVALWEGLEGNAYDEWVEPNEMKWLFKGHQKWSIQDAKDLVLATWNHLGYGD